MNSFLIYTTGLGHYILNDVTATIALTVLLFIGFIKKKLTCFQLTDTAPRSGTEGYETVVVSVLGVFWQEVIRVEDVGILVVFWVPVDLVRAYHDGSTSWENVVICC